MIKPEDTVYPYVPVEVVDKVIKNADKSIVIVKLNEKKGVHYETF